LDVYVENGIPGEAWRASGCDICLYKFRTAVLTLGLETMIELVDVNEDTFKRLSILCLGGVNNSITTKIHSLDIDISSAKQCIACLNALVQRLLFLDKLDWLEQALVTRVYVIGKYPQIQGTDSVKDLRRLLDGTSTL
jgi:hypothetical protein